MRWSRDGFLSLSFSWVSESGVCTEMRSVSGLDLPDPMSMPGLLVFHEFFCTCPLRVMHPPTFFMFILAVRASCGVCQDLSMADGSSGGGIPIAAVAGGAGGLLIIIVIIAVVVVRRKRQAKRPAKRAARYVTTTANPLFVAVRAEGCVASVCPCPSSLTLPVSWCRPWRRISRSPSFNPPGHIPRSQIWFVAWHLCR